MNTLLSYCYLCFVHDVEARHVDQSLDGLTRIDDEGGDADASGIVDGHLPWCLQRGCYDDMAWTGADGEYTIATLFLFEVLAEFIVGAVEDDAACRSRTATFFNEVWTECTERWCLASTCII